MSSERHTSRRCGFGLSVPLTFAAGALVLLIGLSILWAWQSEAIALIQIHPLFAPTHYNLGLGLLALSVGLIAHGLGWRRVTLVCGLAVTGGALATRLGALETFGWRLERWWFALPPSLEFESYAGIAVTLNICFLLAGVCLLIVPVWKSIAWGPFVVALGGLTIIILNIAAYSGYALGPTLSQNVRPSIQGIVGLSLVGVVLLKWALVQQSGSSRANWLPLLVGLSCITATLILWQALSLKEAQRADEMVQFEAVHLQRHLQEEIPVRIRPLATLANQLARKGMPNGTLQDEGSLEFQSPGCLGVAWLRRDRTTQWLVTGPGLRKAERAANEVREFATIMQDAQARGETRMVLAPRSWYGGRTVLFYVPIDPGRNAGGGLVAVFRLRDLLDSILHFNVSPGYALSLNDADQEIHTRFAGDTTYQDSMSKVQRVRVLGMDWQLRVWPTQEALALRTFSLAKAALLVGLLTTLLLAAAVHLAQTARQRARALEREMHERTEAEQALRQSEAKYRSLFENLDQGIFLKDSQGRYQAANEPYCRSFRVSEAEILGKTDAELLPRRLAEQYQAEELLVLIHGRKIERESDLSTEGKPKFIRRVLTPVRDVQGGIGGVLGICWDVTEQRHLEGHLRQSQKMDAIGQLAGGIAHDFNNLLTVILGNLDLLLLRMELPPAAGEVIQAAQKAGRRAASLTNQLLSFSRQRQLLWQPTDLNSVIDEVVALLSRTIDPRIQIVTKKSPSSWLVHGDPGQLNQILMNLCLNARDAIAGHGQITIETSWLELDKAAAARHYEARPGEFVRLRVSDSGHGMSPEVRARLFEPFFTTKEVGKGTGLGLAMVFGIVKQHQGWIECYSEVNRGTRFDIYLPRAVAEAKDSSSQPARPQDPEEGHEMILIVDDEPLIRKLVTTVLATHGYRTLEAEDGLQAVEVFRKNCDKIDLVLLDLTMPKLSGQETFRQLLQIDPEVAVVFASGYSAESVTAEELQLVYGFAKKPFLMSDLLKTLRDALDQVRHGKRQTPVACAG